MMKFRRGKTLLRLHRHPCKLTFRVIVAFTMLEQLGSFDQSIFAQEIFKQTFSTPRSSSTSSASHESTESSFNAAKELFNKGQFAQAGSALTKFTEIYPSDAHAPEAQFLIGMCAFKQNDYDHALLAWNWSVQRYPTASATAAGLEQMAMYYEAKHNLTRTNDLGDQLLRTFPTDPATLRLSVHRGEMLSKSGDYKEASRVLAAVEPQLDPTQKQALAMARALTASSSDPQKLLEIARGKMTAGDTQMAGDLYSKYLQSQPTKTGASEAMTNLGWCLYVTGTAQNLDKAERLWQQVVNGNPVTDEWGGESRWHLVQLLAGPRGRWQDAVKACENIVQSAPAGTYRHEQALYTSAWLLWVNKQWPQALTEFQNLVQVYPAKAVHPPIVAYIADCKKQIEAVQKGGQ